MKKEILFFASVVAIGVTLASTLAFLPGCGVVRNLTGLGWNAKTLALGGALVGAGVALSGNYNSPGSAKSAVDPYNPTFGGITAAATGSATSVTVSWNAGSDVGPPGPITYRIFYAASSAEADILAGSQTTVVNTTSATISTGISPGTTYYFVVRAEDSVGNTDGNLQRSSLRTPLSFGGATSATPLSATSISARWTAATGATASSITYDLYALTSSTIPSPLPSANTSVTGTTSGTITTGLSAGTTYFILVRARTSDSDEGPTPNTVTRSALTRLSFGGITSASALSATSLSASWSAATGASAGDITYTAYASTSSDVATIRSSTSTASVTGGTSVTITGLTTGTTYNVLVRATTSNNDEGTTSANTVTRSALTRLSFGGVTSATAASATSITVNWSIATGAVASTISYRVFASSTVSDAASLAALSPSATSAAGATSVDVTGLTSNTVYNVLVRASTSNNDEGTVSPNTATSSARTRLSFAGITSLVTTTTPTELTASWTAPPVIASGQSVTYTVHYSDTLTSAADIVASGSTVTATDTTTRTITGLSTDTLYRAVVRAAATTPTNSEDGNTALLSARTPLTFAGASAALNVTRAATLSPTVTLVSSEALDVGWTAATGASSGATVTYRVYHSTSSTAATILATTPDTTTAIPLRVTGLSAGTTYNFIVRAISSAASATEDGNTTQQSATTAPSVSGTVTQTSGSTTGNLIVETIRSSNGFVLESQIVAGTGVSSGSYTLLHVRLSGVADAAQLFRVIAFRDTNGNNSGDLGEPNGAGATFTMGTTNRTGENITVTAGGT